MKLKEFKIQHYRSVVDSGIIELSESDNVSVFAGQNESGKSSILRALYDFEKEKFEEDSIPFSTGAIPKQSVSCTYLIEKGDDFFNVLSKTFIDNYSLAVEEGQKVLDRAKIEKLSSFTITKTKEADTVEVSIDEAAFQIFKSAILEKPEESAEEAETPANPTQEDAESAKEEQKEKFVDIDDENNSDIANLFWSIGPKIVFFDDFCDLLPDRILVSDLQNKNTSVKGYRAVKNLEKILNTDFVTKDTENDSVRRTKEDEENNTVSVNFQKDWGQRIHGENKVTVKYNFEKRDGDGEQGSYINFFVETKKGQPLPPKQRSKGLVWFLSLWLELQAQDIEHEDLILLLDEPDQHLHVKAQKDVLALINKLSTNNDKRRGDQVIYATHSPYLIETKHLNRIKLVLNIENEGTKVESIVTSKIDTEYKKDALQPIANAIGLSVSEFSTLKENNVLLEGVSDYYYFSAMQEILNKKDDFYFVPGIGVRKINNLISLAIGYGLNWIAVIDDDPDKGGEDSQKKFDEISEHVFDGDVDKTKEKVYILEGIVGIENMFTYNDLRLVDLTVSKNTHNDKVKVVGKKRKVLFAKMFYEKVMSKEITKSQISKTATNNFQKAFKFIEGNYPSKSVE